MFVPLTSACAAYPAKIVRVVSSSASNRSGPSFDTTMTPWTVPSNSIGTISIDSGPSVDWTTSTRGSAMRVAEPDGLAVGRDPPGQAVPDRDPEERRIGVGDAHERPLEADRLAHPGLVVDLVDADRVVVDERPGPGDDRLGDALDVLEPVQAAGKFGDRPEAVGHRPRRFGQPGVADRGRHVVGEGAGELGLIGRPRVVGQVVEDEQPERHVAEHDRDVADRADPGPSVDRPAAWAPWPRDRRSGP